MVVSNLRHRYNDPVRGLSKRPIPSIVAPSTFIENIRQYHKRPAPRSESSNGHIDIENRFGDKSSRSSTINGKAKRDRSDGVDSQYSGSSSSSSCGPDNYNKQSDVEEESETIFWKFFPTNVKKNTSFIFVIIVVTLIQLHGLHSVLEKSKHSNLSGVATHVNDDLQTIMTLRKSQYSDNESPAISNKKSSLKEEDQLKDITMQYAPNNIEDHSDNFKNDINPKDETTNLKYLRSSNLVETISLPFENISDMTKVYNSKRESPIFWDIPMTGETIAHDIFGVCYHLTRACEYGLQQPVFNEYSLETFVKDGIKFVNVDTTTKGGLQRAKKLELAERHMADVIEVKDLYLATHHLFSPQSNGRLFVLFRNPVNRAVDLYYYLAKASWDPRYNPKLAKMDLIQYAHSESIENNYVTRSLIGKKEGDLNDDDLTLAKKIVTQKCLVGLYEELEGSIQRFGRYFGWTLFTNTTDNEKNRKKKNAVKQCRSAYIKAGDKYLDYPQIEEGSVEWNLILNQNRHDMDLYQYIRKLYDIQGKKIFNVV